MGDSPGIPVDWADVQALTLYTQIERHGWEMVSSFHAWRLTEREAEALFLRIAWLKEHLPQMQAQYFGPQQGAQ